jgi:hypothetical protein
MPKINLPPGCYGLTGPDGSKTRRVKPGSSVTVTDEQARVINKSGNASLGIISGNQSVTIGTRKGRRCTRCGFLAQVWSLECPRCYAKTVPE